MSELNDREFLGKVRKQIDELDDQILDLLNERADCVVKVGEYKKSHGYQAESFFVPEREAKIKQRLLERNKGKFPLDKIKWVFGEIISACLSLESQISIGFLGPKGSYTHQAAEMFFGRSAKFKPYHTILDIFNAISREHSHYGLVPLENSTEGMVSQTVDALRFSIDNKLQIIGEIELPIEHCLLVKKGVRKKDIQFIYAHQQSLLQCNHWLREHFPNIKRIEVSSNSTAAKTVQDKDDAAAIAGIRNIQYYNLAVLEQNIEDVVGNKTRFFVIGRQSVAKTNKDKTAITFAVEHRPGGLFDALSSFKKHSVDMNRLESRPTRKNNWTYAFYVEFAGHKEDENVKSLLKDISSLPEFKLLGSFPSSQ